MTTTKIMTLILIVFSVVGLAVPTGGALQAVLAQPVDVDADTLIQETRDEVEQEIELEAEQEAEQEQEQEQENEQSAEQSNAADASQDEENNQLNVGAGDDNVLTNDNEFGDDAAALEQDNEADQDAANVGVQDQDAAQTIDQTQDAANLNVDFDVQVGVQQPLPPTLPPTLQPGAEPPAAELLECPSGFTFNPDTDLCEQFQTASPICPAGFTFNPSTDLCEQFQTASPCPPGQTFIPVTLACLDEETGRISFAEEHCAKLGLTLNRGTNLCEGTVTQAPQCPPEFTYNPATSQCERTVTRPPS